MMMDKNLIEEVEAIVAEVNKTHKYSMSKIYGAYNKVFATNEAPQACTSCLLRKVKALKEWLAQQEVDEQPAKPKRTARKSAKPKSKKVAEKKSDE